MLSGVPEVSDAGFQAWKEQLVHQSICGSDLSGIAEAGVHVWKTRSLSRFCVCDVVGAPRLWTLSELDTVSLSVD